MARRSRQKRLFWHVPQFCWYAGAPGFGGQGNVGRDIVLVVIDTEFGISPFPNGDEFVLERFVGQYCIVGSTGALFDAYLHHRVYIADADEASVALRTLSQGDDAETSFLWHEVGTYSQNIGGSQWGTWGSHGTFNNEPAPVEKHGRHGSFDIRVARRIEQGQALIWHTFIEPGFLPDDNSLGLQMWARCLVREGT